MSEETKGRAMNGLCDQCGGLLVVERVMDFYAPSFGW